MDDSFPEALNSSGREFDDNDHDPDLPSINERLGESCTGARGINIISMVLRWSCDILKQMLQKI